MSEHTTTLRDARNQLGKLVDAAHYDTQATIITRHDRPHAVLISYQHYQQLTGTPHPPPEPSR